MISIRSEFYPVAQMVYQNMNGQSPMDVELDGKKYKVNVEFPKDRFANISDIETMSFTTRSGVSVPLAEMAEVKYASSARNITRYNGQYYGTINLTTTTRETISTISEDLPVDKHYKSLM